MKRFLRIFWVLFLGYSGTTLAASSGWQQSTHLKAELVSNYQQVTAGQTFQLALHVIHDEHWHTYWQNPGDSGLATSITWSLPDGVTAAGIQWPVPQAISIPPLVNYGYEGETTLLTAISVPQDYQADSIAVRADVDFLICEEICIPAEASLELVIPVADKAEPTRNYQALFEQAEQQLPQPLPVNGQFDTSAGAFSAAITLAEPLAVSSFFVAAAELVDHAGEQQILFQDGQLLLQQRLNTYFSNAPDELEVLLITAQGAYTLLLQAVPAGATDILITHGQQQSSLWLILLAAAAGGIILNLMPCVFPVLSLKALSIAANSQHRQQQRKDAWFYSLGVIGSFVCLAVLLIVLRSAGSMIGWGFQLQSPWLVALLAYLLFALGLSLSGVVQFGLGLMNSGASLTTEKGAKGSFFTGVLAVVVASPCTAPFMGSALGYAVTQPVLIALLVFAALGFGMALPFLLLAYIPALASMLPKPGAWMEHLKQWLAYPLYLSAVWLIWVYGRQTSIDALALLLAGLVCLAAACWLWGRRQQAQAGKTSVIVSIGFLVVAMSLALWPQPQQSAVAGGTETEQHWQPWTAQKLQQLREQRKPVLVNMTADWCITCLVNERVALNTDSSKAALSLYDVTYLKGDWTRRDEQITQYLRLYQRDGVPLYVLYWPGKAPEVLPQILTPDTLRQTLERLSSEK
ncbi:protein-disulfide reductase DsbD family protein [Chromatiaceae bacterium AAb-1]|nr:protein-disulfide reductase DsbD family protein [Chromatiaceae bacterium AAb-1]